MIKSFKRMAGSKLFLVDGQSGTIHDALFDDRSWTLGLFIAKPFPALPSCHACISPGEVSSLSDSGMHVSLSLDEIEARTDIDKNALVGELIGTRISSPYSCYSWPVLCENGVVSIQLESGRGRQKSEPFHGRPSVDREPTLNVGMRSMRDILGEEVVCDDGPVGTLADFLFDDNLWQIRFAVVDAKRQYGKGFLVTTNWVKHSVGNPGDVVLEFSSKELLRQPVFRPEKQINQTYEDIMGIRDAKNWRLCKDHGWQN